MPSSDFHQRELLAWTCLQCILVVVEDFAWVSQEIPVQWLGASKTVASTHNSVWVVDLDVHYKLLH